MQGSNPGETEVQGSTGLGQGRREGGRGGMLQRPDQRSALTGCVDLHLPNCLPERVCPHAPHSLARTRLTTCTCPRMPAR